MKMIPIQQTEPLGIFMMPDQNRGAKRLFYYDKHLNQKKWRMKIAKSFLAHYLQ